MASTGRQPQRKVTFIYTHREAWEEPSHEPWKDPRVTRIRELASTHSLIHVIHADGMPEDRDKLGEWHRQIGSTIQAKDGKAMQEKINTLNEQIDLARTKRQQALEGGKIREGIELLLEEQKHMAALETEEDAPIVIKIQDAHNQQAHPVVISRGRERKGLASFLRKQGNEVKVIKARGRWAMADTPYRDLMRQIQSGRMPRQPNAWKHAVRILVAETIGPIMPPELVTKLKHEIDETRARRLINKWSETPSTMQTDLREIARKSIDSEW